MVLLDSRAQASQWDYGLTVVFSADDGVAAGQEVHFASQGDDTALVKLAEERSGSIVCDVPNQLLTEAKQIRIYAYVDSGTDGRTVKRWQLQVFARPKPDDYVFTETEVLRFSQLKKEIDAFDARLTYIEEHGAPGATDASGVSYGDSTVAAALGELNENYVSLDERTETLENALLGVDTAITGLEEAIGL